MTRLEWKIVSRYLRSGRRSRMVSFVTLVAVGGVTVGIMALIVVLGVMNGLQGSLREKILVATPHVRLLTYGAGLKLEGWDTLLTVLSARQGVVAAAPFVLGQGLISAGHDYAEGVYVVGIEPDTGAASVTTLPQHFVRGDLGFRTSLDEVDGGIVLGVRIAERLSAFPGDVITIVSPAGSQFSESLGAFYPRFWRFEVTGLFDTGLFEYDDRYVVLPREIAQDFAGLGPAVSGIELRLASPDGAQRWAAELEFDLGYPYRALDWATQNQSLFSALQLEKLGMGLVLFFITLVAAFNIVSTLVMVVRDKTREIGILRTMGLSPESIRRIFVAQGVIVGLLGTSLGLGLGLAIGHVVDERRWIQLDPSVYFIDHLPVRTEPLDLVLVVIASLVVATLATLYPAARAASLTPVDAIRYD